MSDPFDIDAKLANQVSVVMNAEGMRISFGEVNNNDSEKVRYFASIYLPGMLCVVVRDLMTEAIEQHIKLKPN